ncbi:MAG TPA: XRE family transcriptional regulator [Thermoanaerobaculia bacterium]|jgi:predicted XRE-type DNA-binding protein|nr:XRE family transcriptional regulator [Thermoanaerobaculia bacterium]
MKKTTTKITRSSGNVFSDLGFGKEEAQHLQIRSTLMIAIQRIIDERQLTQAQAADVFGVTQPRISDLVRGKIELFSIDMLVTMLARAGMHLQIVLSPVERGAA